MNGPMAFMENHTAERRHGLRMPKGLDQAQSSSFSHPQDPWITREFSTAWKSEFCRQHKMFGSHNAFGLLLFKYGQFSEDVVSIKTLGPVVRIPEFEFQPYHRFAVWCWASG